MITPDCQTCGACCISVREDNEIWAEVTMADAERLGSPWCKRNVIGKGFLNTLCSRSAYLGGIQTKWLTVRSGPAKGFELCVCKALKGSPMKKVSCSVYDQRPEVCRKAVKPGDKSCLEIRRELQERIDSE